MVKLDLYTLPNLVSGSILDSHLFTPKMLCGNHTSLASHGSYQGCCFPYCVYQPLQLPRLLRDESLVLEERQRFPNYTDTDQCKWYIQPSQCQQIDWINRGEKREQGNESVDHNQLDDPLPFKITYANHYTYLKSSIIMVKDRSCDLHGYTLISFLF